MAEHQSLGYPYQPLTTIPNDYECPICQMILCEPQQIVKCGHRYCQKCLEPVLRKYPPLCPLDREEIEVDKVFLDQACKRAILALKVKCLNSSQGCQWTGELLNAQQHRDTCPLEKIKCSNENCEEMIERRDEERHSKDECAWRRFTCQYCSENYALCLEKDHVGTCPLLPIPCNNNCDSSLVPRREMAIHVKERCPLTIIECPYSATGCNIKMKRSELQKHLELSIQHHLDATFRRLQEMDFENKQLKNEMDRKWEIMDDVLERLNELERQPTKYDGKFLWRISSYEKRLADAKSGHILYFYSDPFYSGRYGYKFKCCVSLNGDGDAKGSYLSVYINLLRGKFDALLPWPYSHKIVFTLMNQTNINDDIIMDIIPDTSLEGWKRPKSEQNSGVGIWKFAKHETIKNSGYLKDDEIFIKVEVEPFDVLTNELE